MGMCIHYVYQIDKTVNLVYYIQIFIHTINCVCLGTKAETEIEKQI